MAVSMAVSMALSMALSKAAHCCGCCHGGRQCAFVKTRFPSRARLQTRERKDVFDLDGGRPSGAVCVLCVALGKHSRIEFMSFFVWPVQSTRAHTRNSWQARTSTHRDTHSRYRHQNSRLAGVGVITPHHSEPGSVPGPGDNRCSLSSCTAPRTAQRRTALLI